MRIEMSVDDGDKGWLWSAEVSDSVSDIARAMNNPAIFADIIGMFTATAVSVCMKPDSVPPGIAKPFKVE